MMLRTHNQSYFELPGKIALILVLLIIPLIPIVIKYKLLRKHLETDHIDEQIIPPHFIFMIVSGGVIPLILNFYPSFIIKPNIPIAVYTRYYNSLYQFFFPICLIIIAYCLLKRYEITKIIKIISLSVSILLLLLIILSIIEERKEPILISYPNTTFYQIQSYFVLIYQITMRLFVTLTVLEMERRWQDSFNIHIQNHKKYMNKQ